MEIKWAVITGATSGIGCAVSRKLAPLGYNLIISGRRQDRLQELKAELEKAFPIKVEVVSIDLGSPQSCETLFARAYSVSPSIDLLVNNAGFGLNAEFLDEDLGAQLKMIDLNVSSLTRLSHLFGNRMKQRQKGMIVHTASMGGFAPTPYYAVYGATKAYVISFSESLAEELRKHHVHVITLCPGATETEFAKVSGFKRNIPSSLLQSADQVAEALILELKKECSTLLIPGTANRISRFLLRMIPHKMATSLSAKNLRP